MHWNMLAAGRANLWTDGCGGTGDWRSRAAVPKIVSIPQPAGMNLAYSSRVVVPSLRCSLVHIDFASYAYGESRHKSPEGKLRECSAMPHGNATLSGERHSALPRIRTANRDRPTTTTTTPHTPVQASRIISITNQPPSTIGPHSVPPFA